MARKLLFINRIHESGMALAHARDDVDVQVIDDPTGAALEAAIRDANGIVVRTTVIDAELIAAAPALEVVSRHGVGYNGVDVGALTARGIPLTITPGANAVSVAEHAFFMLLALAKQCLTNDRATRGGDFERARVSMRPVEIEDKTLLIIGFGRTGSRVAPRARAFGMRVLACDPYIDQGLIVAAGASPVADFRAVLAEADVVTVHTPLTPETCAMIGARELAAMKDSALLINTARGGIVDEATLAEALACGAIGGAGVDVFECEPASPPATHPLFGFDNVILSPHCAGVTFESGVRMGRMATRNVLDVFDGRLDPEVVVNAKVLAPAAGRA